MQGDGKTSLVAAKAMLRQGAAPAGLVAAVVLLFVLINYIHFRVFDVDVVLYSAMLDAAVASAVVAAAGWRIIKRWLTPREAVLSIFLGFSVAAFFALAVPTIIDRSLSIYILEKLAQRGGGIREDAFPRVFKEEYLPEHHLVEVRLTEQLKSGTIKMEGGCVRLTARGWAVTEFSRAYRKNMLPAKRHLLGVTTDALTDPFRNSKAISDYVC